MKRYFSIGIYASILAASSFYAWSFDFRRDDYSTHGIPLIVFHLARFFLWIGITDFLLLIGGGISQKFLPSALERSHPLDRILIYGWTSYAAITILMLPLGLLGGLHHLFLLFILMAVLIAGHLRGMKGLEILKDEFNLRLKATQGAVLPCLSLAIIVIVCISVYFLRANRPFTASIDTFEHYIPYQQLVLDAGNTKPNDVWYHFFQSKGIGLTYFCNFLTGILGSQIASMYTFVLGMLSFGVILRRLGISKELSCLGISLLGVVYLGHESSLMVSWNTHHLQMSMWILGMLWLTERILNSSEDQRADWRKCWYLSLVGWTVFFPLFVVLLAPFVAWVGFKNLRKNPLDSFEVTIKSCASIAIPLILIFLINYQLTGMMMDNPKSLFWKFADQEKFSTWSSPYLVQYFIEMGSDHSTLTTPKFIDKDQIITFLFLMRFDILKPILFPKILLFLIFSIIAAILVVRKSEIRKDFSPLIFTIIISFIIFCLLFSSVPNTLSSIMRNYSFLCISLIIPYLVVVEVFSRSISNIKFKTCFLFLIMMTTVILTCKAMSAGMPNGFAMTSLKYGLGLNSTQDCIRNFPGIKASVEKLLLTLPADAKVLMLTRDHIKNGSFVFPGPGLLSEPSRFSGNGLWHRMAYETPFLSKKAFLEYGIQYFYIDLDDIVGSGSIAFNEIFSDGIIQNELEIVGHENNQFILGWKNGSGVPLTQEWINRWTRIRNESPGPYAKFARQLDKRVRMIYQANREQYPIRKPEGLPDVEPIP